MRLYSIEFMNTDSSQGYTLIHGLVHVQWRENWNNTHLTISARRRARWRSMSCVPHHELSFTDVGVEVSPPKENGSADPDRK